MREAFPTSARRFLSERTREALAASKAKGVQLGRPREMDSAIRRRIVCEANEKRSLTAIARGLNEDGIPTTHGGKQWYPSNIQNVLIQADLYHPRKRISLSKRKTQFLRVIQAQPGIGIRDLASRFRISYPRAVQIVNVLCDENTAERKLGGVFRHE